ncbi:hypothetical protein [Lysinibacillus sp. Ag94]|uniref:hypothetical protein n=1 Tax=Lysinibacillus sp. Ag94 TaxID=2936682 RepID=UPI0020101D51|nr:hypothetical protein [Lysinibacillus sp. Ag94]UPW82746.1 hypothetical protein MY533_18825 [Lysinibacillus sp. Ag94]
MIQHEPYEEVSMYICNTPLVINILDNNTLAGKEAVVIAGSKWRRDDKQKRGLSTVHLLNLSGKVNEEILWLEIEEQVLEKHFLRI